MWRRWDEAAGGWRQLSDGGELLIARGLGDIRPPSTWHSRVSAGAHRVHSRVGNSGSADRRVGESGSVVHGSVNRGSVDADRCAAARAGRRRFDWNEQPAIRAHPWRPAHRVADAVSGSGSESRRGGSTDSSVPPMVLRDGPSPRPRDWPFSCRRTRPPHRPAPAAPAPATRPRRRVPDRRRPPPDHPGWPTRRRPWWPRSRRARPRSA